MRSEPDIMEFVFFDFCEVKNCYVYRFDYAKFYQCMQRLELQECDNEEVC